MKPPVSVDGLTRVVKRASAEGRGEKILAALSGLADIA
jgi:hypothetical protein